LSKFDFVIKTFSIPLSILKTQKFTFQKPSSKLPSSLQKLLSYYKKKSFSSKKFSTAYVKKERVYAIPYAACICVQKVCNGVFHFK
jgi:hypothetical protein